MKKIITMLFVLIIIQIQIQAQKEIPIIIRGEFNLNNVKNSDTRTSQPTAGLDIGIGIETEISLVKSKYGNFIAFNPSVSYMPTSYKPDIATQIGKVQVNYISLAMPLTWHEHNLSRALTLWGLLGRYSHETAVKNTCLLFGFGPYFSYALSGNYKTLNSTTFAYDVNNKMTFGNSIKNNRTAVDAGLLFKVGVNIGKVYATVQKDIGITNVMPKDRIVNNSYIKTRSLLITLGYNIGKKSK